MIASLRPIRELAELSVHRCPANPPKTSGEPQMTGPTPGGRKALTLGQTLEGIGGCLTLQTAKTDETVFETL